MFRWIESKIGNLQLKIKTTFLVKLWQTLEHYDDQANVSELLFMNLAELNKCFVQFSSEFAKTKIRLFSFI